MATSIDEILEEVIDLFTYDESHSVNGVSGPMPMNFAEAHILARIYHELALAASDNCGARRPVQTNPWIAGYAQLRLHQLRSAGLVSREALERWSATRVLPPSEPESRDHDGDVAIFPSVHRGHPVDTPHDQPTNGEEDDRLS